MHVSNYSDLLFHCCFFPSNIQPVFLSSPCLHCSLFLFFVAITHISLLCCEVLLCLFLQVMLSNIMDLLGDTISLFKHTDHGANFILNNIIIQKCNSKYKQKELNSNSILKLLHMRGMLKQTKKICPFKFSYELCMST